MSYLLAIDAGTTSVRSLVIDADSSIVDISQRELTQYFPRPGWVEHDAVEIWDSVSETLQDVCSRITEPIIGIGITNQRETVVAWNASTGQPLHKAIVWQDSRTVDRCEELLEKGYLDLIRTSTGLVLDPYFSGTKYSWLLNEGEVTNDTDLRLGTIDSWILWNLTGGKVHATDPSNASRTMLFDISSEEWSEEICELLSVPIKALPKVMSSAGRFGETGPEGPVKPGIPISGIAGDQQAALFGQACFTSGQAKNTYGTGGFVLANLGNTLPAPVNGLLTTIAWKLFDQPSVYALEGSIFSSGSTVQWLRDGLGIIDQASDLEGVALSVPDCGGVYTVPAFNGLGSPWWDPRASGMIIGLTRGTGRGEIARSVIESMSFQTRDVVDAMRANGHPVNDLRIDGGASAMNLLMDIQSDQLKIPVTRSATAESTALGAAWLAGLAEGVWASTEDLAQLWKAERTALPSKEDLLVDREYEKWVEAVQRSKNWN